MTPKIKGKEVVCSRCSGHGQITTWSFGVKEPEECPDCHGNGTLWLYPSGTLAAYYGGPFRAPKHHRLIPRPF